MFRRIIPLLFLLIVGCSSVPTKTFSPAAPPKQNESLVYVYRMTGPFGRWVPFRVIFNERDVVRLPNNTSLHGYFQNEVLNIRVYVNDSIVHDRDEHKVEIRRELMPGRAYYFKLESTEKYEFRVTRIVNSIQEVSKEQADREMAGLDMLDAR